MSISRSTAAAFDPAGAADSAKAARRELHLTLRQANYDYERVQYNTVVSAGYKMLNALESLPPGVAGVAVGLAGAPFHELPAWAGIRKVEIP